MKKVTMSALLLAVLLAPASRSPATRVLETGYQLPPQSHRGISTPRRRWPSSVRPRM